MIRHNASLTMGLPMSFTDPIPSTSTASSPGPESPYQCLLYQHKLLNQLAEGEGILVKEWDGLFEKCYVCDKYMLEAVFQAHSRDCWYMSDEEPESDTDEWGMH